MENMSERLILLFNIHPSRNDMWGEFVMSKVKLIINVDKLSSKEQPTRKPARKHGAKEGGKHGPEEGGVMSGRQSGHINILTSPLKLMVV